jgi:hypothetical protein
MLPFSTWLADRGAPVADAISTHGESICERVSSRMMATFPNLCFDPLRFDAASFQKQAFRETPRRFHRLLQVVLLCNSMNLIEREYRWGWRILSRMHVERRHMLAQVRWYFEEIFSQVPLINDDKLQLIEMRDSVLHMIEQITATTPQLSDQARRRQRVNGYSNGRR